MASTSVPDGAMATSVSDPVPLPLLGGSGLSRAHLVLATQALKLPGRPSLPGLPSVCHDQGGLVLDRVLAHCSGDSWWAVLSGRAKLGRLAARRGELLVAASDASNYSLCSTARVQLNKDTVLRSRLDWSPPLRDGGSTGTSDESTPATTSPAGWTAPISLSCQLRSRIGTRAEARADLAVRQRASSSLLSWAGGSPETSLAGPGLEGGEEAAGQLVPGGRPQGGWAARQTTTPLLMGLQAGSVATQGSSPLVWRAGVLQVTAPPAVRLPGRIAGEGDSGPSAAGASLQSAVYMQGTAALQGERFLWRAPKKPVRRSSGRIETGGAAAKVAATGQVAPSSAPAPAAPLALGPQVPARQAASGGYMRNSAGTAAAVDGDDEGDDGSSLASAVAAGGSGGSGRPVRSSSANGSAAAGAAGGGGGAPFGVELPTAGRVQEALMDTTQSISRLRDDVTQAACWVGEGGLVEQLKAAGPSAGRKQQRQAPSQRESRSWSPWSSFVGEPHVRVAGVAGVTARAPVIMLAHGPATRPSAGDDNAADGESHPGATGAAVAARPAFPLLPLRLAWLQDLGLKKPLARLLGRGAFGAGSAAVDDGSLASAGAGTSSLRSSQVMSRGSVRPFASAAASVQYGRFSGWLLDYTRLTCQLDCGLWGPASKAEQQPQRQQRHMVRHPAFALGDRGAWHALSVSLSQQVLGPLRFAADLRYRLSSSRPLALPLPQPRSGGARAGSAGGSAVASVSAAAAAIGSAVSYWVPGAASSLVGHVGGMRPQLVDAACALDLAVPGTMGAARLVAWYAPLRREGMVEVRLF